LFQYKDAFLNANPDFKWYKLPAPPLRTLNTRPTNKKQEPNSGGAQSTDSVKSEYESSDFIKSDRRDGQLIQPGKLADESQIGGLSSLFTPQKTSEEQIGQINGVTENDVPKPPKKRYTESPFQSDQKRDCKADLFGEKKRKKTESNNNEQHEHNTVRFRAPCEAAKPSRDAAKLNLQISRRSYTAPCISHDACFYNRPTIVLPIRS
jgi:hypothetical protein